MMFAYIFVLVIYVSCTPSFHMSHELSCQFHSKCIRTSETLLHRAKVIHVLTGRGELLKWDWTQSHDTVAGPLPHRRQPYPPCCFLAFVAPCCATGCFCNLDWAFHSAFSWFSGQCANLATFPGLAASLDLRSVGDCWTGLQLSGL